MSQQDVETLSRGYEAFATGDTTTVAALMHDDISVEVHTGRPDMAAGRYQGHDGFFANFAELTDVFDELRMDPTEIRDHGGRLFVACRMTGKGRASGVAIDTWIFHVWTLRDGRGQRLQIYNNREQAEREATG